MASTLLLDGVAWDLVLDANGNIAAADEPYALAQDAASAIRTWLGECYWDTTVGVPYRQEVFAGAPLALIKQRLATAAITVPDVASARVFISGISERTLEGQVQVTAVSGQVSAVTFQTSILQGV